MTQLIKSEARRMTLRDARAARTELDCLSEYVESMNTVKQLIHVDHWYYIASIDRYLKERKKILSDILREYEIGVLTAITTRDEERALKRIERKT